MQAQGLDPECEAVVREAAKLCENFGHHIEEATIPGDVMAMQAAAQVVISASVATDLDAEAERRGRPLDDAEVEGLTMVTYRRGKAVDASAYVRGAQVLHAHARAQAKLFETCDVLLLPTLGSPPSGSGGSPRVRG